MCIYIKEKIMAEESAAKKAMRAMLNGSINEDVVKFAEANKKIDNKLGDATVTPNKKQSRNVINEDFDSEYPEPDYMSDIKKKLLNDRANGKTESFIDGHQSKPTIEITSDVISKLLKGKVNEAKEAGIPPIIKQQIIKEEVIHNSNPIEQYRSPKQQKSTGFEDIDRELLLEDLLKSPELKALLLELILDNVVSNGRLQKIVHSILKDQIKPILLQTLKDIKSNK